MVWVWRASKPIHVVSLLKLGYKFQIDIWVFGNGYRFSDILASMSFNNGGMEIWAWSPSTHSGYPHPPPMVKGPPLAHRRPNRQPAVRQLATIPAGQIFPANFPVVHLRYSFQFRYVPNTINVNHTHSHINTKQLWILRLNPYTVIPILILILIPKCKPNAPNYPNLFTWQIKTCKHSIIAIFWEVGY